MTDLVFPHCRSKFHDGIFEFNHQLELHQKEHFGMNK